MMYMLRIFIAILCFFCIAGQFRVQAQDSIPDPLIRVGTQLTYRVDTDDARYDFILTIDRLDSAIAFHWRMPAPVNKSGSVLITPQALREAMSHYNMFSSGDTVLEQQTSVFISRKMYEQVIARKPVVVQTGSSDAKPARFSYSNALTSVPCTVDGERQLLDIAGVGDASTGQNMLIIKDKNYPFIARMNIGFRVRLVDITHP